MNRRWKKTYTSFNNKKEYLKRYSQTNHKLQLIKIQFESKGIKIEKLEKGEIIQCSYKDKLGIYYIATGIHNYLPDFYKKGISFLQLEQRVTENSFDEFLEAFVHSTDLLPDTEKIYNDEKKIDNKIELINPIILDVNKELLKFISIHPNYLYNISSVSL